LVWDPLTTHLSGASTVFVVPDGALNLVSFPSFPIGTTRYLVETGPVLHLLTAERDLLRDVAPAPGRGLLAVGGASYNAAPGTTVASIRGTDRGCDNVVLQFGDLPGARREQRDNGILTAEEVASLDLHGTEWAVLSACETGLGEIKAGEGVVGLRRAFQIAGVRTVIMSLWSVEDQATRAWMRALYQERFQNGASTAEAVRNASVRMLRDRRAHGQSPHPFYWAAFVAAGDWT
jgi:hypothetical protein